MSESRRLAAILAAALVGYSRLAGADEKRMLALPFVKISGGNAAHISARAP